MWVRTYDAHNQFIRGIVTAHQQGIIDDKVAWQEVSVTQYGSTQNGLTMRADVKRIIVHQFQEVLVEKHHLTALLSMFCLYVPVS